MSLVNMTRNESCSNCTTYGVNATESAMMMQGTRPKDYSTLTFFVPLSLLTVLVNGVVFLLFAVGKSLRTPANYLLLSLAVADFTTGTVIIPIMMCMLVPLIVEVKQLAYLFIAMTVLIKLTAILTSYHILAVTVEKYLAIVNPLRHHIANPKKAFQVIFGIWFISAAIAIMPLSWGYWMFDPSRRATAVKLQVGHDIFCFVVAFLVPYIIIVYSQVIMFKTVAHSKKMSLLRRSTVSSTKPTSKWSNERKCLVIFAVMAGLFALCWLPWFLLSSLATVAEIFPAAMSYDILYNQDMYQGFLIIRLLNCIVNPLLYTFFKRDFTGALKKLFCGKRKITRNDTAYHTCKEMPRHGEETDETKGKRRLKFGDRGRRNNSPSPDDDDTSKMCSTGV